MKATRCTVFAGLVGLLVARTVCAALIVNAPMDVIGNLTLAQFTGDAYSTQSYKDWGNEPFVAVNPVNTNQIVVSSFSYGTSSRASGANLFYSTDGGASWTSQFSVPAPASGISIPRDWTFGYDSAGNLHAAVLGGSGGNLNVYQGSTTDPTSLAAWTWTAGGAPITAASSINHADQPWLALRNSTVFVGYDVFNSGTVAQRVTVSTNNGASFGTDNLINNGPVPWGFNPGTRLATDAAGTVYAIFGISTGSPAPGVHNMTYYLNRSRDNGQTWDFNASSAVGGIVIDSGRSSQADLSGNQASNNWFAGVNNLLGSITAIAADKTGAFVYVLIGKQDGAGTDRIYLAAYQAVGGSLVQISEIPISPAGERAALPSITVTDNGTVIMTYQTYGADGKVHVHVASSNDFGASVAFDIEEYAFTPLPLQQATGSASSDREFGDFVSLTSVGDTFYGVFAGLGNVDTGGVDTRGLIDPFFFTGTDVAATVPEPASWSLLLIALFLAGGMCRGRLPADKGQRVALSFCCR